MMGWILTLLQSLPAILAAISQVWAIIGPLINHLKASTLAASGEVVATTDYHLYVTAQAAGFTVLALALACCQPTANRAFRLLRQRHQQRALAEQADELREQIEALPACHRERVFGSKS